MIRLTSLRELVAFWYLQRVKGFATPTAPWFHPEALARFQHLLPRARLYFEFGSGGSTLRAAQLAIETVSVESDRFYARAVRSALPPGSSVSLLEVDIGITGPMGYPLFRNPTASRIALWRRYAEAPFEKTPGRFPDLILIDGRFRLACALLSLRRAADAGADTTIMIDDYSKPNRSSYAAVEYFANVPERVGTAAFFTIRQGAMPHVPSEANFLQALRDPR